MSKHSHKKSLPSANENLSMSSQGRTQLILHEGVKRHYYNDAVNNCTFGVGTLAHLGVCSAKEKQTPVPEDLMATSLQRGISDAENIVKRSVKQQVLTQQQFDALVSFTYNLGPGGAHQVLRQVNSGHFTDAAQRMMQYIHATVRGPGGRAKLDKTGHKITQVLRGLVRRRAAESAPFVTSAASQTAEKPKTLDLGVPMILP